MPFKPCLSCRSRKIRCDGTHPVCGPCTRARKSVQCVYPEGEARSAAKEDLLRKGAACAPCRMKKKKCDGQQPYCKTCQAAGKEADCQYSDPSHRSVRIQLSERISELEERLRAYEEAGASSGSSDIAGSSTAIGTASSSNFLEAFTDSFIPQSVSLPSSNRMQLPHDFDFSPIREQFFAHAAQLGLCLTTDRRVALLRGNTSLIHPALLHAAQLWGCTVSENAATPYRVLAESILLQDTVDYMKDASLMIHPTTALQVHQIVSTYHFTKSDMFTGREHLLKASHIILQNGLRIIEIAKSINRSGSPSICRQMTLKEDEQLSVMCQLISMDRAQGLTYGTPYLFPDNFDAEVNALPSFYKALSLDTFSVVSRTVSITYLRESQKLISDWRKDGCCTDRTSRWYTAFNDLITRLKAQIANLQERIHQAMDMIDVHNERALKIVQMMALSALTDLHLVLAPTILDWRKSAIETTTQILHITSSFKEEDYSYMDPVIALAWTSCINCLRIEVSSNPILMPEIVVAQMMAVLKEATTRAQNRIPIIDLTIHF